MGRFKFNGLVLLSKYLRATLGHRERVICMVLPYIHIVPPYVNYMKCTAMRKCKHNYFISKHLRAYLGPKSSMLGTLNQHGVTLHTTHFFMLNVHIMRQYALQQGDISTYSPYT